MASSVSAPRGMRDFLPADKARRERVLAMIRENYAAHGFDEIETPVMEDYARLHAGLGGDNEKLSFSILKRGLDAAALERAAASGDAAEIADLGLRFDLTVPLTRFYASHRGELPPVFKSIQIGPVWRAERPQKGRYRQFVQCDIDVIGEAGPIAEVELLQATLATIAALGLDACRVRINDRRLLNGMLDGFGFPVADQPGVLITIDKLDKVGPNGVIEELRERGVETAAVDALAAYLAERPEPGVTGFGADTIRAALPAGADDAVVTELSDLGDAVGAERLIFDPFLVRGMGYYTGTIFEIEHPELGYSLGGGGRYDGLVGRFLGQDVPACGFSFGFERIVDLVTDEAADARAGVVLVHERTAPLAALAALKAELIAAGERVRLEPKVKNLKALLARCAELGYGRFALVPADVPAAAELELKDLG